jgi:hypothetical protein
MGLPLAQIRVLVLTTLPVIRTLRESRRASWLHLRLGLSSVHHLCICHGTKLCWKVFGAD